jgi:hypothetical protein
LFIAAFSCAVVGQGSAAAVGIADVVAVVAAGPEVGESDAVTVTVATATGRVVTGAVGVARLVVAEAGGDGGAVAAGLGTVLLGTVWLGTVWLGTGAGDDAAVVPGSAALGEPPLAVQPASASVAITASPQHLRASAPVRELPACIRMGNSHK